MFDEDVAQQYGERRGFTLLQFSSKCETGFAGGEGEGVGEVLGHISPHSCSLAFSRVCCCFFFGLSLRWFWSEVRLTGEQI